jgi:hypothetical protein
MARCNTLMQRICAAVVVSFALAGMARAGEPAAPKPMAETLPDGTIMFAQITPWSDWSRDFSKTSLARIFSEPEVKTFLAGPFAQISQLIKRVTETNQPEKKADPAPAADPNTSNAISYSLDMLGTIAPGPHGIAVRFSEEDARAKRPPAVAVILGINEEKNVETYKNLVSSALKTALENWKIDAIQVVDDHPEAKTVSVRLSSKGEQPTIICVTLFHGRLILANELLLAKQIVAGLEGKLEKKLSDTEAYKRCELAGDEHLTAYMDIASLRTALGALEKVAGNPPDQLDDFFVLSGLNKSIAVAWSLKMRDKTFESRTAIFSQGEREGIMGMLSETPLSADTLKLSPKASPLAAGFNIRPDRVMKFVRDAVLAVQGKQGLDNLNKIEETMNKELGRDLKRDVEAAFGTEFILTSLAGLENVSEASAVAAGLSVKDAAKADEVLDAVLKRYAGMTDAKGVAANLYKILEHDGKKIRYLEMQKIGGVIPVTPAFVITDNRLIVAFDVVTLKRAMKQVKDGPSLSDSDAFKAALAQTGDKMGPMFSYIDWAFFYKSAYNFSTGWVRLIAPTDVLKQFGVDMNLLPPTETVAQHLFPGLSVAQVKPNGIVLTSRSPLPSFEVLSPPVAAATAVFAAFRPLLAPVKVTPPAPAPANR